MISHFTGVGKREHNEDSYLVLDKAGIYLVCDGVGGAAKGEVASRICCDTFREFFTGNNKVISNEKIQEAVIETEKAFDKYIEMNIAAEGMATTLAFLAIRDEGILIAHAGDSRVYHIRDGRILFVTRDHTELNALLASGFLTKEAAKDYPRKNVINLAIHAGHDPVIPDFNSITDIRQGDFFFLCSDGILESVSEEFMQAEFRGANTPEMITHKMKEICALHSKDNYTGIVIQLNKTTDAQKKAVLPVAEKAGIPDRKRRGPMLFYLLILLIVAVAAYFAYQKWGVANRIINKPGRSHGLNIPDHFTDGDKGELHTGI